MVQKEKNSFIVTAIHTRTIINNGNILKQLVC